MFQGLPAAWLHCGRWRHLSSTATLPAISATTVTGRYKLIILARECLCCNALVYNTYADTTSEVLPTLTCACAPSQLGATLAGGPISLPESAGIALQIVQGLQELHSHSIVHKALKPSNILLDPLRNIVVLSDFAVSAELDKVLVDLPISKPFVLYT